MCGIFATTQGGDGNRLAGVKTKRWVMHARLPLAVNNGRGERIRTSDSCVPNAVLYQAELHPELQEFRIAASRRSEPILTNIVCILNQAAQQFQHRPTPLRAMLAAG
jgi:hypothetical protein